MFRIAIQTRDGSHQYVDAEWDKDTGKWIAAIPPCVVLGFEWTHKEAIYDTTTNRLCREETGG